MNKIIFSVKHSFILASVILIPISSTQAANLILNGSFESPQILDGTFSNGNIDHWSSTVGSQELLRNTEPGFNAYDGEQFVELDAAFNSDLFQDVPTTPGSFYSLSFQYSPRPGQGELTNPVEIWFGGTLLETLTGAGTNETMWTYHNYLVQGGVNSISRVEFRASGISDAFGGFIDDVKLEPRDPKGVPEGGTAALLFGLALFSLEGARRRLK
jgi:hypothetical protein